MAEDVSPKPRTASGRDARRGQALRTTGSLEGTEGRDAVASASALPTSTGDASVGVASTPAAPRTLAGRATGVRRLAALARDTDPTSSARRRVLDRISDTDEADVPPTTPSVRPVSVHATANEEPRTSTREPFGGGDRPADFASSTKTDSSGRRFERSQGATPAPRSTRTPTEPRGASASTRPPTAVPRLAVGPAAPRVAQRVPEELGPDTTNGLPSLAPRRPPPRSSVPHDELRSAPSLALSPRMTAVFGGLFGLATITTIIALLIQAAPPKDERALAGSAAAPGSSGARSASTSPVAAPSKKPIRIRLPAPWRISDTEKDPSVKIVSDTMERRSFVAALTDKGVSKDQVYRILKAFETIRKFDKSSKNDKFIASIDRETKQVKAFEYVVGPQEIYQARDDNGVLKATQLDLKVADAEIAGSVYIGKNLAKSIDESGLEESLSKVIDEAFAGRMSSEGLEEGGTLRVIAIETTALGEFAKYKQIVAIEYHPADPAAAPVRAYSFEDGRVRGYFDEKGRQPDGSGWGLPVPGAPITSHFNLKRMHPILHKIVPHTGTDFGAPSGTPIYAAFKGKLTNFGPAGPCGNMAQIDHPGSVQTGYCHMSKFAAGLKLGSLVGTKQLIGYVGTTGRSTGPHLHFWAKRDGKFFDAETLHMNGMRAMPAEQRDAFAARKAELDARLDALPMPEPPPPAPHDISAKDDSGDSKDGPPSHGDAAGPDEKTDGDKNGKKPNKAASHAKPSPDDEGEDLVGADLGK